MMSAALTQQNSGDGAVITKIQVLSASGHQSKTVTFPCASPEGAAETATASATASRTPTPPDDSQHWQDPPDGSGGLSYDWILGPSQLPVDLHFVGAGCDQPDAWDEGSAITSCDLLHMQGSYKPAADVIAGSADLHYGVDASCHGHIAWSFRPSCSPAHVFVTLPAIDISYHDALKLLRVRYDPLPLDFAPVQPAPDATCSYSGSGTLNVRIGIGPSVMQLFEVLIQSKATAHLDILRQNPGAPDCRWPNPENSTKVVSNCVVGGSGDLYLRWHTDGFHEIWHAGTQFGAELYNSGPFTYCYRVHSVDKPSDFIPLAESDIHVTLTQHLGWIRPFYAIQEPPNQLLVKDKHGHGTGATKRGSSSAIPYSVYRRGRRGWSGVLLFGPQNAAYRVIVTGPGGSPYTLAVDAVVARTRVPVVAKHFFRGGLPRSGTVIFCAWSTARVSRLPSHTACGTK
ncbi:hypothetical protein CLV35_2218 [Motilibacter peucedani]|uniref:Uncharacterized protein n=1 Tax=Motilibacter peucedani TaxID=598650 RepID=A0A420XNG0_9ACTN|nr:hypothetical protein CLV35_2218 [Motilibacter peucedani]